LAGDHVRSTLGPDIQPALLSRLEEALASLGAALAANDKTNIERQLRAALDLGASRDQLAEVIETARVVQENAGRIHVEEAQQLLDELAEPSPQSTGRSSAGCGCGSGEAQAPQTSAGHSMFESACDLSRDADATPSGTRTGPAGGCGKEAWR
jgi:hypothetical protein